MKKVLVTGAAGAIGSLVIKYLLSEGKYEITGVDLPNSNSTKRLRRYNRRINVLYADLTDPIIVDALVKDHDYIIHLAGVMPPFADLKEDLGELIDYKVTENLVRAIDFYNPSCTLICASSTVIYGKTKSGKVTVKTKVNVSEDDYYAKWKKEVEKLIKKNIKNYIIFRLPLVLTDPRLPGFVYNGIKDELIEVVSDQDAAYAFVKALDKIKTLNKNTYNIGGGENCQILYSELLIDILKYYGFSFKYLVGRLLLNKNYYGYVYEDSDELENILNFRNDSVASYMMRLKRRTNNKRVVARFIGNLIARFKGKRK